MARWNIAGLLLLPALLAPSLVAQRWALQYFYDHESEELNLVDLAFPSAQRGIAVGWIEEQKEGGKREPTALVTGDGGAHWALVPLKEEPRSIFFLNDSMGWMVTDKGIWVTQESGRSWTKLRGQEKPDRKLHPKPPGGVILRVWFLDEHHGFAVGYQKTVLKTSDGGRTWTPVKLAADTAGNPALTTYTQITFDGQRGLIVGAENPLEENGHHLPAWMTPEQAARRQEKPHQTLLLESHDHGATWAASSTETEGQLISLSVSGTAGLNVFNFSDAFEWPSEAFHLNLATGKVALSFRQKNRRVTDAILFPGSRAFLASIEPPGRLSTLPIPGAVKILSSTGLDEWKEMDVDYRAAAGNVMLAGPDANHVWAATDTGMVLHLQN
jgi:Photosynthesis system II assembly factor YCF48